MPDLELELPSGWKALGGLPDIEPGSADEDDLLLLTEDLFQVETAGGEYSIDVSFLPESSREGEFVCRIVQGDGWALPQEEERFKTAQETKGWVTRAVAPRQSWPPGHASDRGETEQIRADSLLVFFRRNAIMPHHFARPQT